MRNGKKDVKESALATDIAQFRLQLYRRRDIPTNTGLHGYSAQRILYGGRK